MERYSYLRPEHEKGWLDRVGGWLAPVAEWCKEHWIEIAIGIACIVAGALLTFATGGAFLPALLLGLKSAAMAGLISGGVSAGISVIGSIMSGDSLEKAFFETADAFGDGLASGFMFGGILAGGSQGMAAAFRLSSSAKVKAINFGKIRLWSPNGLKNKNPGGTLLKIGKTFRFDFEATKHLFHTHIPKSWFNSFPKTLQGMKWLFEAGKSDVHVNLTELLGGVWGGIHSR
jgi:hypothetical protein